MKILVWKKAFTFVELIVVTVIIAVLWAVWFSSFVWNLSYSRDTQRKANLSEVSASLKLYKKEKARLPAPWAWVYFTLVNSSSTALAFQWKLSEDVWLSTIDKIPLDPKGEESYAFSVTNNRQEFQLSATLENDEDPYAIVVWDFKSVSQNILPSLIIAYNYSAPNENIDITIAANKNLFVFDGNNHNFAYDHEWNWVSSDWTTFATLLSEAQWSKKFTQNSSYETCEEVSEAWKYVWNWEYQLRSLSWSLVSSWCTLN